MFKFMNPKRNFKGFNTKAVQGGELRDPRFGNVTTPIFQSSTFIYPNYNEEAYIDHTRNEPYIYTRWGNPTLQALENKFSELENAKSALSFSSGMSAIVTTILSVVKKGDKILSVSELYGQTHAFFTDTLPNMGVAVDFVPIKKLNALEIPNGDYKLLYTESITNPTLQVSDLIELAKLSREKGIPLIVDSTFASPYNQRPIDLGAEVSVQSGTKYISGHSDLILGMMATSSHLFDSITSTRRTLGGTPDPIQAFLAMRGLKTLGLRMEKHNKNGMEISKFLSQHKKVRNVFYPGLPSSEFYEISKKVLKGYGGMVSFEVDGGIEGARKFVKNLEIAEPAPSLGGVESLVTLPVDTSHSTISAESRRKMGINDGLVRFSIGIEDCEDIIEDLQNALGKI